MLYCFQFSYVIDYYRFIGTVKKKQNINKIREEIFIKKRLDNHLCMLNVITCIIAPKVKKTKQHYGL